MRFTFWKLFVNLLCNESSIVWPEVVLLDLQKLLFPDPNEFILEHHCQTADVLWGSGAAAPRVAA
jgi:hypothetical protein